MVYPKNLAKDYPAFILIVVSLVVLLVVLLVAISAGIYLFKESGKNEEQSIQTLLQNDEYGFSFDYKGWEICQESFGKEWLFCRTEGGDLTYTFRMKVLDLTTSSYNIEQALKKDCDRNFSGLVIECNLLSKGSQLCNKNGVCYRSYSYEMKYFNSGDENFFKRDSISFYVVPLPLEEKFLIFSGSLEALDGLVVYY